MQLLINLIDKARIVGGLAGMFHVEQQLKKQTVGAVCFLRLFGGF